MRLFTAIQLPEEVRKQVWHVSEQLQKLARRSLGEGGRITWVKRDALHVTFQFLGELAAGQAEIVKSIYSQELARCSPVKLKLQKLDGLPNKKIPRAIVITVGADKSDLHETYCSLANSLASEGIKINKANWNSHITLGRVKSHHFALPDMHVKDLEWEIEGVELIESCLTKQGPIYKKLDLFSVSLGK